MSATIIPADRAEEAALLLREGKLVAFPTDTVYGVAALADSNFHSTHLAKFKGDRHEPFAVHVPDVASALRLTGPLRELSRHAITTLGPQRVTVVVAHGSNNRGLGLRVVQHELGAAFLRCAGAAVVATSASAPGQPPLRHPAAIARLLGLDAVLDAGELPERRSSSVVRMLRCGIEVLREGELALETLRSLFTRTVEFVCLGNLNRSAFAHHLLNAMQRFYADRVPSFVPAYDVQSSGLIASARSRSPRPMQSAAARYHVDLSRHVPVRFDSRRVGDAALPVAMGDDVAPDVLAATSAAARWTVYDPMGGPDAGYVETAAQVRAHMESLLARAAIARASDDSLEAEFDKLFSAPGDQT